MRLGRDTSQRLQPSSSLTPFVDVIFLLVLFFVFTLKFVVVERQLYAQLPRGGVDGPRDPVLDLLRETAIYLDWDDAMGERVRCGTSDYLPPSGGAKVRFWYFPEDPGARVVRDATGKERRETVTRLVRPDGTGSDPVVFDYVAPDFRAVESYIARRRAELEAKGILQGPRVTIYQDTRVPWQMVVSVIDILTRQQIEEFGVAVPELRGTPRGP